MSFANVATQQLYLKYSLCFYLSYANNTITNPTNKRTNILLQYNTPQRCTYIERTTLM